MGNASVERYWSGPWSHIVRVAIASHLRDGGSSAPADRRPRRLVTAPRFTAAGVGRLRADVFRIGDVPTDSVRCAGPARFVTRTLQWLGGAGLLLVLWMFPTGRFVPRWISVARSDLGPLPVWTEPPPDHRCPPSGDQRQSSHLSWWSRLDRCPGVRRYRTTNRPCPSESKPSGSGVLAWHRAEPCSFCSISPWNSLPAFSGGDSGVRHRRLDLLSAISSGDHPGLHRRG